MNRLSLIFLCAAAGMAGWGGMSWWRGMDTGPVGKPAATSPAAGKFATPGVKATNPGNPGSPSTAEALALALALDPADEASLSKLNALPPGSARDLALALFQSRRQAAGQSTGDTVSEKASNPFADLPSDATPAASWMDAVRKRLLAGDALEEFAEPRPADESDPFGRTSSISLDDITRWAALDPAAASETILQMPAGKSRTAAVDAAAKVMARDNPQAAWDLVVKSGEQKLGEGAARAWLECAVSSAGTGEQGLAKLPASLREAVLNHTAALLNRNETGTGPRPFTEGELKGLSAGLRGVPFGPGKEAILIAMMDQKAVSPDMVESTVTVRTEGDLLRMPEMELLHGKQFEQFAENAPEYWLPHIRHSLSTTDGSDKALFYRNSIAAAAPEIFAPLVRAGHVKEVGPLVEHIPDPQQRRAALESILPQWMDADPAAARAAFDAAPFTALERERWQRHPAFLLHP